MGCWVLGLGHCPPVMAGSVQDGSRGEARSRGNRAERVPVSAVAKKQGLERKTGD